MKKHVNNIPISRLVAYIIALCLLPLFFIGYFYIKQQSEWDEVLNKIAAVHSFSEHKARKQALNMAVRAKYSQADDFFLDNQVESLTLLRKEREALENLIQNPSFTGNEAAEKRYTFLAGEANRIQFTQGSVHTGEGGVQETAEILAHPVEANASDLKELLARIEGERPGKPQLLVTDFWLKRKAHSNGNEVFEINLKLLKREFTQ